MEDLEEEENVEDEIDQIVFMSKALKGNIAFGSILIGSDTPNNRELPKNLGWGIDIPLPGMFCLLDLDGFLVEDNLHIAEA